MTPRLDLQRSSICFAQHKCAETLAMVHSGGNAELNILESSTFYEMLEK